MCVWYVACVPLKIEDDSKLPASTKTLFICQKYSTGTPGQLIRVDDSLRLTTSHFFCPSSRTMNGPCYQWPATSVDLTNSLSHNVVVAGVLGGIVSNTCSCFN